MKLSVDPKLAYLTLMVSAVFYSLYLWLAQPPLVTSENAPAREFSAQRAMSILEDLLQHNQPHPVGSAANQFVRSRIEAKLDELGIGYSIQSTWACRYQSNLCAEVENIIARIPGDPGRESIVLMAHYDSVPTSTGAGDDGAAVAAILETARALSFETPLARPVTLLFTDGEEDGLLGAEAFFADPALIQNIGAVLNYEGSGSKGVSRVLRTAPEGAALIDLYQASANPAIGNSISSEIFKRMPNDTDFSVVIRAGLKGIDFAFAEERNHYHSHNDSIQNLDLRTLQHHGNNMLPLVRQLLAADVIPSGTSMVYLDIYGQWLQWPDSWQPWLILMALLMLAISTRVKRLSFRQLASGCAISLAILISAFVSGFAAFQLLTSVLGPLPGWPANSWGFRIVLFAAPLFGGLLIISLLKHRTTPANLFLTNMVWLFFISLFMVAVLPSAAINFLLALLPLDPHSVFLCPTFKVGPV